ncbi:MAG: DinB family protein [Gemmatimonadetes bacterium]|nr:DinB family protein [Gemmatimonadota bacterium]
MITVADAASRLASNGEIFRALVDGVSSEEARWKPAEDQWSVLEVVCHLRDEEVEDFRRRLDLTLHRPEEAWPSIDPPRWAVERRYNERSLAASLEGFLEERGRSVEWLRGLEAPDLSRSCSHPRLGRLSAGDLLTSWLAHDLIHVRQITRVRYGWLERTAAPWRPDYAGPF